MNRFILLPVLILALMPVCAGLQGNAGITNVPPYRGDAPAGVYNVAVRDQHGQPVPGVVVQFCDTACRLYTTDPEGLICFTGEPVRYNIRVMSVPEGYSCDASFEAVCDGSGEWVIVEVEKT